VGLLSSIGRSAVHINQVRREFWDLENIAAAKVVVAELLVATCFRIGAIRKHFNGEK